MTSPEASNIHHRRRWYYVLWTGLLLGVLGLWFWAEQPTAVGVAKLEVVLTLRGAPAHGRAALWIGRQDEIQKGLATPMDWVPVQDSKVALSRPVHMARRHLGHAYMLSRTDDYCVVIVEASGQRRYYFYDLREDIGQNLLRMGRRLQLGITANWASLPSSPEVPTAAKRAYIGW